MHQFRVFVPSRKGRTVSYPPSGHPLYSREEAVMILQRFYGRSPWEEGGKLECWAESENERFTLHCQQEFVMRKSHDSRFFVVRLGDQADYAVFDTLEDLAEYVKEAGDLNDFRPMTRHCLYGVKAPGFSGQNYISLYVGESVEQPVRNLTDRELSLLNEILVVI